MKKIILSLLFILSFSCVALGQILVKGRVVDEENREMPGVTVQIKGTQYGTTTNVDGDFEIRVISQNDTLIFRFVGYISREIKVSGITNNIVLAPDSTLEELSFFDEFYHNVLKINYWGGLIYNPYGISISKEWHYVLFINHFYADIAYGTNFKGNYDFRGGVGTKILKRRIYYSFQNTSFKKSNTQNTIQTHLVESVSNIKIAGLLYGIGHQTFLKEGLENNKMKNYGVQLGLSKYFRKISLYSSVRSFYWQDYWAWEANLNREFYYRKLRLNTGISYRQTAKDFKEVNLTFGYIF